ncbi:hypothetical protein D3C80_1759410 [compost metagenome]
MRIGFITLPAYRVLQHQPGVAHQHGAVFELIESGRQRGQLDNTVAPFTFPGDIPARIHRREMSVAPVAPTPQPFVRQKIVRLSVEMQHKITHLVFMRFEDCLQTPIDAFLREPNPGQRPADFVDIQ